MTAGAEKSARRLRPEKPWFRTEGPGFDSRHLHCRLLPPVSQRRRLREYWRCIHELTTARRRLRFESG